MSRALELKSLRFGKWTVITQVGKCTSGQLRWKCVCDCGTQRTVAGYSLKSGDSKSCGCGKSRAFRERNTLHGDSRTRLYKIYYGIKNRCYDKKNENYRYYGKKGIKMCKEWMENYLKFKKWAEDSGYAKNLTIDRINNNGNYEPNNCRWVSMMEQNRNKSNNFGITLFIKYN